MWHLQAVGDDGRDLGVGQDDRVGPHRAVATAGDDAADVALRDAERRQPGQIEPQRPRLQECNERSVPELAIPVFG